MGQNIYNGGSAITPKTDYESVINAETNATLAEDMALLKKELTNYGEGGVVGVKSYGAILTDDFNYNSDWFAEVVVNNTGGTSQNIYFGIDGNENSTLSPDVKKILFQIHQGTYRFSKADGTQVGMGAVVSGWNHVLYIHKQDEQKGYVFVNGVLYGQQDDASSYSPTKWSRYITLGLANEMKLFRLGYFANGTAQEVATAHFNGNNPFSYEKKETEQYVVDIEPSSFSTTKCVNEMNGKEITFASNATLLTENKWANPLEGEGVPTNAPIYKGQTYKDTTSEKVYTAVGNTSVNDWTFKADSKDLANLKTEIITYGNSHWLGGGSGGSADVVVVNGVGDGATDDTEAIMTALELARSTGKALYFPKGTWLTRKGLVLTSNMIVTSAMGATLKSASAVLNGSGNTMQTTLSASASIGDTTINVVNANGFVVGQQITIWQSGSYTETKADITAVSGNTLTIDTSRFTADGSNGGCINAYASGSYVLTDFALIETYFTKSAENIIIENITLEPCSLMTEPHIYTISPISQTKQMNGVSQKNFRVYNVTILQSAHDGISVQGSGEIEVIGCRVFNQKHKGIHWGTSCDMVRVMNNYVYGCGSSRYENFADYQGSGAMFFCSNNHRVIITGNHIENCYKGIYGFNYQGNGERDTDAVIANNTFKNCTLYGLMLRGGDRMIVNGNNFLAFSGSSTPIYVESDSGYPLNHSVITSNTIGAFDANHSGVAINVVSASNTIVANNVCEKAITIADGLTNVVKVNNLESV